MVLLAAVSVKAAPVTIIEQGGWFESGYVTWQKTAGVEYNVYVSPASSDSWTQLDDELVREYPSYGRADALGLKAGSYKFKVVPVKDDAEITADAAVSSAVDVKAHDRSGFAHQQAGSEGIGAYNNDGTLKSNARVVYVWADNAKTVSLDVAKNAKGQTVTYTGLQQIIYGYQKGDENGSYEKRPLCVRIIGTIKDSDMDAFLSSAEGLQIKGQKDYGPLNITIEGVGNDAAIWGFGILIRNAGKVELRNFGIYRCMDDCVSIDSNNTMIWVHNVDFFYGKPGSDADQAKGDGALDFKGDTKYCTFSYNHFYDSGKSNLGGLDESGDNFITLHHNWYDHSDSRHPRIRRMSMHIYNNYFDGNSKYGVGMTTGGSAFVENNYFRNCKYPMLISMQGSDIAFGKGTFSSEPGGIIKSFGNHIIGARTVVTYQENQTEFDCWEASTRSAQVPATVKCKDGGTSYNNFDTNASLMYSYTPDAAVDVPAIVKGQYGAGRMQHGDFKWTFNNSAQDENYGVIDELTNALLNYKSTLVGFFDGTSISNGGATTTVDGGDGKGLTEEQQNSYMPSWAGGSGGVVGAGLPDPNFCGPETESGSKIYDYFWFNEANQSAVNGYINDKKLILSEGSAFKPTTQPAGTGDNASIVCNYTGVLDIAAGGYATFYCEKGVSSVSAKIFRTGDASGEIQISSDGVSFTKMNAYSTKKDDQTISASANKDTPVYVRITNGTSGHMYIPGIKIMYPDPNGSTDPGEEDPIEDDTKTDASFEFEMNGSSLAFINGSYSETLVFDDPTTTITIKATPNAEGATISSVTGATATADGSYTFDAPAAGESVSVTFSTVAPNGTTTKTYTIKISREIDPSTIPVETGNITLQSDNIPEGYKVDGSSSVAAYTYSSDLCKDAKLFKASAAQHTVTLPANAKVTKIVMYAVGDNNTTNKGKITELAGEAFAVDLPSRKTGTAFATAIVENVEITGSFTYTVTYTAGVKFALTVEKKEGGDEPGPGPQPTKAEKPYMATGNATDGFNYYWFNADNETEVNGWLSDGTIVLTDGTTSSEGVQAKSSFKKDTKPGSDSNGWSEKTGTIEIAKAGSKGGTDGGTATFYCKNGIEEFKMYLFRTGTYNFHVYKSSDGENFTEIASDTSTGKGKLETDYSSQLKSNDAVYVKIQNTSTGGLNIQGILITYLEATGINNVHVNLNDNGCLYDLMGRRVTAPQTGKVYIQNGKKFIMR